MASLNRQPGSSTPKQRMMLHKIKRRHGWSDDELHESIGASSVKILSAAQASAAIERLGGFDLANRPGQKPRPYKGKKRTDAVRMITDDHVEQIVYLGIGYFGEPRAVLAWLAKNFNIPFVEPHAGNRFGFDLIRRLGTAQRAGEVIRVLKEMIAR